MPLPQFALVKLLGDDFRDRGVRAGDTGVILDVYGDKAYEVEFSRDDGTTIAWFAVPQDQVALATEAGTVAFQRRHA
jgi:uncharacterized protein DUF4926